MPSRLRLSLLLALIAALLPLLRPGDTRGFGAARATAAGPVSPLLRVHPLLQVGAQRASDTRVRVVVQKRDQAVRSIDIAVANGLTFRDELPLIRSFVAEMPQGQVLALARDPRVRYVTPDAPVRMTAIDTTALQTTYEQAIGVPGIWNSAASPANGKGVTVAVLDSGINPDHPAFASDKANVIAVKVNPKALGGGDAHGHGTHVAGIIKGNDALGRYIGVAPGARVISVKIADDTGAATESDLIKGLQWVYDNRTTYNIRVVNASVSASVATAYAASPINAYVEQLWLAGITVVVSAGNRGSAADATWYAPGNDPYVISAGAIDHAETISGADDTLGTFSSRGQTQDGFAKPDVVAPGRRIVAPLAKATSTIGLRYPDRIVDTNFIRLTGTSMSAPVVAGVVALLLERYPTLTPNQIKGLLRQTASSYPGQTDGAGVINPAEVFRVAATGPVPVANQGLTPASAVDPTTNTVTTTQSYWDQSYWDQSYWDQSTWNDADLD